MSKDKKTLAEKVFDLIKSLSKTERRRVLSSSELSENAKPKSQKSYLRLYKIYSSFSKFSSIQALEKFGGEKSSFKVANGYLRTIILESLATENSKGQNILAIAQKAKEKGFPRYAKQLVTKEIYSKLEAGTQSDLVDLFGELEVLYRYHLPGEIPKELQTKLDSFYSDLSAFSQSKLLYARFKDCLSESIADRLKVYEASKDEVQVFSKRLYRPQTQYQVLKTLELFHLIGKEFEKSANHQAKALYVLQKNRDIFADEKLVTQTHLRVLFLINLGELQEARGLLTDLASKEFPVHIDKLLNKYWVSDSIYLAAASGDLEYVPRAIKDYSQYEYLLTPGERQRLSHAISVLYFHRGDWASTLLWQGGVSGMPKSKNRRFLWLSYLVKSVCYFEQGYFFKAKGMIQKYLEFDPGQKYSYPSVVLGALKKVLDTPENLIGTKSIFKDLLKEYSFRLENDLEFQSESMGFTLEYWLKSKNQDKPIYEIVSENFQSGTPLFLLA